MIKGNVVRNPPLSSSYYGLLHVSTRSHRYVRSKDKYEAVWALLLLPAAWNVLEESWIGQPTCECSSKKVRHSPEPSSIACID